MAVFERLRFFAARTFTSRLGRETLSSMGLKFSSVGLAFLSTVILARVLGTADYGAYSYVYALATLLSVPSEFGLPTLVMRETAIGMAQKDYALVKGVWRWSGRMVTGVSLGLVLITGISVWLFQESLAGKRLDTFVWALALVPLVALGNLRGAALRGLHHVARGQLPEFLLRPAFFVLFLCLGALLLHPFSAPSAMALYVLASALAFGVGSWLLLQVTPSDVNNAPPRYEHRAWLLSILPLAFIDGMIMINQQSAIIMQGFFLTDNEIGVFRIAVQLSRLSSFGLMAINMVVAPRIASLYTQKNMQRLQHLVVISARWALIINLLITFGYALFGSALIRLFFGDAYRTAYLPTLIMLVGQVINSLTGPVAFLLNMTNYESSLAKGFAASVSINALLNMLLIPRFGIVGSAFANSFALLILNTIMWWMAKRNVGISCWAFGTTRPPLNHSL